MIRMIRMNAWYAMIRVICNDAHDYTHYKLWYALWIRKNLRFSEGRLLKSYSTTLSSLTPSLPHSIAPSRKETIWRPPQRFERVLRFLRSKDVARNQMPEYHSITWTHIKFFSYVLHVWFLRNTTQNIQWTLKFSALRRHPFTPSLHHEQKKEVPCNAWRTTAAGCTQLAANATWSMIILAFLSTTHLDSTGTTSTIFSSFSNSLQS